MSSSHEKRPAAAGSLKERPVPRLLQQLFRNQVTGCLCITDQSGDESDVYLRVGTPVHVDRPVDADRLDRVLIEHGVVTERAVELARPMVTGGMRLGEALERMGALTKETLASVLKAQVRRKLTRLFCVSDGEFAVYLEEHGYGAGDDHAAMRVDPRTLYFPAIRSAYDLARVTRELSRLWGQEFRLASVSPPFISAMSIPSDDPVVASLRSAWMTLEKIDTVTTRSLEARTVLLSLYYADLLERQNLVTAPRLGEGASGDAAVPISAPFSSSDSLMASLGTPRAAEAPAISQPAQATAPATEQAATPQRPPKPAAPPAPKAPAVAPAVDTALRASLLDLAGRLDKMSHFELLGVSESAAASDISAAFFRAARRYHPDRLAGAGLSELAPQAERVLARMSEASMILGDPARRADYVAARAGKKPAGSTVPTVVEAETIFLKGEVFLKKGDYAQAIEHFTAACKANPGEPQFRAYLAWARFDNPKGRKEAVVREVQRTIADVVTVQPRFARGHYWLGEIWKFLNEPARAEQAFREAVKHDPELIEATRELRLFEMRRSRAGGGKGPNSSGGGLMGRLFKK